MTIAVLFIVLVALVYAVAGQDTFACPLNNVDVVIFASNSDFPMMYFTLTTLSRFMPCSHKVHLMIDRADVPASLLWFAEYMGNHRIVLHAFESPSTVPVISGMTDRHAAAEIGHRWGKLWADKLIEEGDKADYIMFLDVNTILAMPVTCKSLFDAKGRLHHVGVPMDTFATFFPTCLEMTGGKCDRSYMSVMPFVMPRQAMEPMRAHIHKKLDANAKSFDDAFNLWLRNKDWHTFNPYQIMGEYMRQQQSQQVHQIYCPAWPANFDNGDEDVKSCESYIPPALYYDYPVQEVLKIDDKDFKATTYRSYDSGEFKSVYGSRFALPTMNMLEVVVDQGDCIGIYLYKGHVSEDEGCTDASAKSIHKMLDLYFGKRTIPWTAVEDVYAPSKEASSTAMCSQLSKQLDV